LHPNIFEIYLLFVVIQYTHYNEKTHISSGITNKELSLKSLERGIIFYPDSKPKYF